MVSTGKYAYQFDMSGFMDCLEELAGNYLELPAQRSPDLVNC